MFLVVGLGNPGNEYAGNRHNIGFMAADIFVRRHSFGPWRSRYNSEMCEGTIGGEKVLVQKPLTYMNRSGQAVGEAARFFKIAPEQVIILHDELELPPGRLRVKQGGGHAGHNGLRDIDAHIGNPTWRVRLGIGRPHDKALVHNWVLGDFAKADGVWLEPFLQSVADRLPLLLAGKDNEFMNEVTLDTQPPKPPKAAKIPEPPKVAKTIAEPPKAAKTGSEPPTVANVMKESD